MTRILTHAALILAHTSKHARIMIGAIRIMQARQAVPGPTDNVAAIVKGPETTNMDICKPGWEGNDYKTYMPGNTEFSLTCQQPFLGALDIPLDPTLFRADADEQSGRGFRVCNMDLAERLSAPSYFTWSMPNQFDLTVAMPITGNVPLVNSLDMYAGCVPYKTFMDPFVQNYGPANGVDRRALTSTLHGTIYDGPISTLLNSAELRGFNPSQTYMQTFDPALNTLPSAPANPGTVYPYAQPY
jgi:hypothetical protein